MLPDFITAVAGVLGVGAAWYFYVKSVRADRWVKEKGAELARVLDDTRCAVDEEKRRRGMVSRIDSFSAGDPNFLNKVSQISELKEMRFVFDAIHREIYEAAVIAPNAEMILNAIGKGKGVRLVENKMARPETLYTAEVYDAEV